MAKDLTTTGNHKPPAGMQSRIASGKSLAKNFSGGVRASFPVLSIRGSKFIVRNGLEEKTLVDPNTKAAVGVLDVVMLNASPYVAKAYYVSGYEQDDHRPPDCWSLDGAKPDATVVNKVNPVCPTCPMNVFGSAPAREGEKQARRGKACADNRRVALMMPHDLGNDNPLIFMLKIPGTSLRNLADYSNNLDRKALEPAAVVTRLRFDPDVTYPKLKFDFIDTLTDEEFEQMSELADSRYVLDMLQAPDVDNSPSTNEEVAPNPDLQPRTRQAPPQLEDEVGDAPVEEAPQHTPRARGKVKEEPAAEAKPDLSTVESTVTEIEPGVWMDEATGELVPAPQPKVDMPQPEPDVVELKDGTGRYWNKRLKAFVTGPHIGAKPVTVEAPLERPAAQPASKKRPGRPKKTVEAQPEQQPEQSTAPQQEEQAEEEVQASPANGSDPSAMQTAPAPSSLEAKLRGVLPKKS